MALRNDDVTRIQAVQAAHRATCDRIRGNEDLSDTGRRAALARSHATARAKISQIRDAAEAAALQGARDSRYRLFGVRGTASRDVVSWRHAMAQAEACESPVAARDLAAKSERYGDAEMARAVAAVAWDRAAPGTLGGDAWEGVLGDWLGEHPEHAEDARELAACLDATSAPARLHDSAYLALPAQPEFRGWTDSQIAALAAAPAPDAAEEA
jgi:hypothetical protein